jgi:hypothetical protein
MYSSAYFRLLVFVIGPKEKRSSKEKRIGSLLMFLLVLFLGFITFGLGGGFGGRA